MSVNVDSGLSHLVTSAFVCHKVIAHHQFTNGTYFTTSALVLKFSAFFLWKCLFLKTMTESLSTTLGLLKAKKIRPLLRSHLLCKKTKQNWSQLLLLAEPEFMYCANSRKIISMLENSNDDDSKWNTKIYAFICYMYVSCLLLQIEIVFCLTQILLNSG